MVALTIPFTVEICATRGSKVLCSNSCKYEASIKIIKFFKFQVVPRTFVYTP